MIRRALYGSQARVGPCCLPMPTAATSGRSQPIAGDNRFGLAPNADTLCVGTRTDAASEASGKLVATAENGQPQNRPQPRNNALGARRAPNPQLSTTRIRR